MTTASEAALRGTDTVAPARHRRAAWLLLAVGVVAFGAALAVYIVYAATHPVPKGVGPGDLRVYRDGGLIVRHLPPYRPHRASPLYDWPGFESLPFTYPPFAAMVFTVLTLVSFWTLWQISIGVSIAALLATIWMTFGGLGYRRGLARLGATLLLAAPLFWTEPVQRTLFVGQVELVLMALIIWDQCQPDRRWWKGAGIGIAAGIKLVPGIFILYLLRARRAAVRWAAAGLAAGIILVFGAWPGGLWSLPSNTGGYFEGLIWIPPVTNPELFFRLGDRPWYAEYHWHGLQLITGNLYILTGIALFALLVVLALEAARRKGPGTGRLTEDPASEAVPAA